MKKTLLLALAAAAAAVFTLSAPALEAAKPEGGKAEEVRSVAWYVANIQEARAKNKECYSDPGTKALQATPNCVNSLQALRMSFVVAK